MHVHKKTTTHPHTMGGWWAVHGYGLRPQLIKL